jgi:hypothetical protein
VLVLAGTQAEIDAEPADVHTADRVVAAKEMPVRELVEDELHPRAAVRTAACRM